MDETIADIPATFDKKGILTWSSISIGVIALYFVPYGLYILYPFILLNTFIHELGHGYAAKLAGWNIERIELWQDGSGVSQIQPLPGASQAAYAFVALGGIVLPVVVAAICLVLGRNSKASRIGLYVFAAISVISIAFFIRDVFSLDMVTLYCVAAFILARFSKPTSSVPRYAMLILAIALLTSVISQSEYLFSASALTAAGEKPSDIEQAANNLSLPIWACGSFIIMLAVAVLFGGIVAFFYHKPQSTDIES